MEFDYESPTIRITYCFFHSAEGKKPVKKYTLLDNNWGYVLMTRETFECFKICVRNFTEMENEKECVQEHEEYLHKYEKYARVIFKKIREKDGSDKLNVEYKSEIAKLRKPYVTLSKDEMVDLQKYLDTRPNYDTESPDFSRLM